MDSGQFKEIGTLLWDRTGKQIGELAKIIDACPRHERDEVFCLSVKGIVDSVKPILVLTDEDVDLLTGYFVAPLVRLIMERNGKREKENPVKLPECFEAKKEFVFTEEPMTEEERIDLVTRAKAMIERMKPFKDAHEDEVPSDIKMVLLINKWMNPWAAINELEKIVFKFRTKRKRK